MENSSGLMQLAAESAARMDMSPYYLYRQKNMRGNLENTGFAREGCECLYNILIMEELQTICAAGAGASTKTVFADGRIERSISPKDVDLYIRRMTP
jgi:oxygen-independent coproporphyrinogen-3 oxidase